MSNGPEGRMWKATPTSSSSRLTTLKSLVPTSQRTAMRAFFDRRVPSSSALDSRSAGSGPTGVVAGQDNKKLSWREWAGDKIRGRGSSWSGAVEKVSIFPGWASRRYHDREMVGKEAAEFSLEVFVSGFAASYVPPESATRSQRAFMRLAKAYAALPKLPSSAFDQNSSTSADGPASMKRQLSSSTEDLLKSVQLPPTPNEITEESEIAALERQFQKAELDIETDSLSSADSDSTGGSPGTGTPPISAQMSYVNANAQFVPSSTDLSSLHANLNSRLQPFWSRSLANRVLRVSLYSSPPHPNSFFPDEEGSDQEYDPARAPIHVQELTTTAQGAFEARLHIPWERICVHPGALHIAFGEPHEEAEVFVCAELLPPINPNLSPIAAVAAQQESTARTVLPVAVSQSEIRLISDVDDTIKLSNILGGARAVFRNVFVKQLEELVITGMGDWYSRMWSRGVRFHYVSNSPFELLPVINEFIKVSNLPQGSIKLRSYAGRSLFNGLLSAPATRKRAGIVDILNAFNDSRFFLVGDSGEQDLELYAQIAAERHNQILAVFIRDARGPDAQPIDDPTGEEIKRHPNTFRSTIPNNVGVMPQTPGVEMKLQAFAPEAETPTQKTFKKASRGSGDWTPRLSSIGASQDYMTAVPPSSSSSTLRPRQQINTALRTPSDPVPTTTPTLGLPSTYFDSGLISTTSSPSSSRPSSPAPSIGGLQFPGSLSEQEIANLGPAERRRYKLQERVYRARLLMPSHISLRVFMEPEECGEADRILNDLIGNAYSHGNGR